MKKDGRFLELGEFTCH